MSYSAPPGIYQAVKPYAGSVPDAIWEDIVYTESSFNPNAYNPAGAYGLFQLLYPGGQGEAAIVAGHSVNDLYNPSINAQYGMPAVRNTWAGLGPSFDNSLGWWEKFAAESGHPGGAPGQAYTDQVAQQLKDNYQGGTMSQPSNPWSLFWNNVLANLAVPGSAFGTASSPSSQANNIVGQQIVSTVSNPLEILSSGFESIAISVGVFVVAMVFVVIGFVVISHE